MQQIVDELAELQGENDADEIESLRRPAFNDVMRENNHHEALLETTRFERAMAAIA